MTGKMAQFIGDVARPVAIIASTTSVSIAMVVSAFKVENGGDAAMLIGAGAIFATGIYASKAVEETVKAVKAAQDRRAADQVEDHG